jgi:hypothetical protein
MQNTEQIIQHFNLKPLPEEGGYYRELYRSEEIIDKSALPERYDSSRCFGTSILFLLKKGVFSALHRLKSDEVYHFHSGDPVKILLLSPNGDSRVAILGNDITKNHQPQLVIPKGTWQGCCLKNEDSEFALMGCTVSPGFEFEDFEVAERKMLIARYPQQKELITKLTRK